jgi:hypothetical protein
MFDEKAERRKQILSDVATVLVVGSIAVAILFYLWGLFTRVPGLFTTLSTIGFWSIVFWFLYFKSSKKIQSTIGTIASLIFAALFIVIMIVIVIDAMNGRYPYGSN